CRSAGLVADARQPSPRVAPGRRQVVPRVADRLPQGRFRRRLPPLLSHPPPQLAQHRPRLALPRRSPLLFALPTPLLLARLIGGRQRRRQAPLDGVQLADRRQRLLRPRVPRLGGGHKLAAGARPPAPTPPPPPARTPP